MAVATYDPKEVIININGIPISGFADGTFINVSREKDAFTKVIGSDGVQSRAKSNDRSGMIVLTLVQTSASNDTLSALAIADEVQNAGVAAIIVKDVGGRSTFISGNGWVRKMPDSEFSNEITNREWTLDMAEVDIFVGGTFPIL